MSEFTDKEIIENNLLSVDTIVGRGVSIKLNITCDLTNAGAIIDCTSSLTQKLLKISPDLEITIDLSCLNELFFTRNEIEHLNEV